MRPPARPGAAVGLAQLAGVTGWSRCRSGQCVACWEEQRTAMLTGQRPPGRRPARWSGLYQGHPLGLCAFHHGVLAARPAGQSVPSPP